MTKAQKDLLLRADQAFPGRASIYLAQGPTAREDALALESLGYGRIGDGGFLTTFAISDLGRSAAQSLRDFS